MLDPLDASTDIPTTITITERSSDMYGAINLYALLLLRDDRRLSDYTLVLSGKRPSVKLHEFKTLRGLVERLQRADIGIGELDGYHFSYVIPKIGKEFDLLRISDDAVLNIELKSVNVGTAEIRDQLERNRYYLRHLGKRAYFFTYVLSDDSFYTIDGASVLRAADTSEVMEGIVATNAFYPDSLDTFFDPEDYIFSPADDPLRFLEGRYFLTQHQEWIEKQIFAVFSSSARRCACISGGGGSGKTLLLYDLALRASRLGSSCIVKANCAESGAVGATDIVIPRTPSDAMSLSAYDQIFIDDAHMLAPEVLDAVLTTVIEGNKKCVLAVDALHRLSCVKRTAGLIERVKRRIGCRVFELTDRITVDPELSAFASVLIDKSFTPEVRYDYEKVKVFFASDAKEARALCVYYQARGYSAEVGGGRGTIVVLDEGYRYDGDGKLTARGHKNGDVLIERLILGTLRNCGSGLIVIVKRSTRLFRQISEIITDARR